MIEIRLTKEQMRRIVLRGLRGSILDEEFCGAYEISEIIDSEMTEERVYVVNLVQQKEEDDAEEKKMYQCPCCDYRGYVGRNFKPYQAGEKED